MSLSGAFAVEQCPMKTNPPKPLDKVTELNDCLNRENQLTCSKGNSTSASQVVGPVTYGLFSAKSSMESLFSQVAALQEEFLKESKPCPDGCKTKSKPSIEIQTTPLAFEADSQCPASYMPIKLSAEEIGPFKASGISQVSTGFKRTISVSGARDSDCQKQGSEWAKSILAGDNELGKFIGNSKCKDPCSYASGIRITRLENANGCSVDAEVSVLCGPPKKSRDWKSQARLIKAVVCEESK